MFMLRYLPYVAMCHSSVSTVIKWYLSTALPELMKRQECSSCIDVYEIYLDPNITVVAWAVRKVL